MNKGPIRSGPMGLALFAGAVLAVSAGCSGPRNAPVDAAKAREALRAALDSWKSGAKADALQGASPPIYVIDPEWQAGAVLKDYQILDNGQEMDAHLFASVRLSLGPAGGRDVRRDVTYVISTAPNVTVSRKMF